MSRKLNRSALYCVHVHAEISQNARERLAIVFELLGQTFTYSNANTTVPRDVRIFIRFANAHSAANRRAAAAEGLRCESSNSNQRFRPWQSSCTKSHTSSPR